MEPYDCPVCIKDLSWMQTAESRQQHVLQCLDATLQETLPQETSALETCFFCHTCILGLDTTSIERHINQCMDTIATPHPKPKPKPKPKTPQRQKTLSLKAVLIEDASGDFSDQVIFQRVFTPTQHDKNDPSLHTAMALSRSLTAEGKKKRKPEYYITSHVLAVEESRKLAQVALSRRLSDSYGNSINNSTTSHHQVRINTKPWILPPSMLEAKYSSMREHSWLSFWQQALYSKDKKRSVAKYSVSTLN
ncbi:hypothetical protein BDF14DRAFT_1774959 [Spinellus fusiger]|nr:hypothetical protein BDF14DRAFT_1774959 [Spinellus fusiger]